MWTGIWNVWNEADHIFESIMSFSGVLDRAIIIDGAYKYYPYQHGIELDKPYSTDKTTELAGNACGNINLDFEIVEVLLGWESETEKKNHGLKNFEYEEGDYVIFLDGHEVLEGDFNAQKKVIEEEEWELGRILVYDPQYWTKGVAVDSYKYDPLKQWRILRWHEDLELKRKHWNYVIGKVPLIKALPTKRGDCELAKLAHMTRNPERELIRNLHKSSFGPYKWDEDAYIAWRNHHNVEDGQVQQS
jgi:hypothetical protein